MTQPKSKSSKKSPKKSTTPVTAKKRVTSARAAPAKSVELVAAPPKSAASVAAPPKSAASVAAPTKSVVSAPAKLAAAGLVTKPVVAAAPVRAVTRGEFMELVRREAYRMAARRHFKNGSPFQDWVNAETAVQGQLKARGLQLS